MIKFSPDKWEVDGFDFARRKPYKRPLEIWARLDTNESCPKKIAILPKNPRITEEEEIANARLIAAAPEMYGLLKTLSQRVEENEAEILGVMKMPFTKTRKGVSVDKDNSSYWEVKSFFNFSETKALLARIDGE